MKHKKIAITTAFLLLGLRGVYAQESTTTAGGEASGSGGVSSYSIGQIMYTTAIGTSGSISQGVQVPFEISIITDVSEITIDLSINAYPNPTVNQLTLEIEKFNNMRFHLSDVNGELLESGEVTETNTSIEMEALPQAIYFLRIVNNSDGALKTFKIIKN